MSNVERNGLWNVVRGLPKTILRIVNFGSNHPVFKGEMSFKVVFAIFSFGGNFVQGRVTV